MDAILATFLVAACGGMSIVAYRHFDHYKPFSNIVTGITVVALAVLVAYEKGLKDGAAFGLPGIFHRVEIVFHAKVAVLIFVAYGAFLEYLPKLLKLTK